MVEIPENKVLELDENVKYDVLKPVRFKDALILLQNCMGSKELLLKLVEQLEIKS